MEEDFRRLTDFYLGCIQEEIRKRLDVIGKPETVDYGKRGIEISCVFCP